MDELISYIKENENVYHQEYEHMMNDVENDEEECNYERWHSKHFNSNWFFTIWKNISKYDIEIIQQFIDEKYLDFITKHINWTLISRQCDFNDEKFMTIFGYKLCMDFAKRYNNTYVKK